MFNNAKDTFQWINPKERYPGAPPYVVGLPKGEGFNAFKVLWFDLTALKSVVILIITQLFHVLGYLSRTKFEFKGVADLGLLEVLKPTDYWEKVTDLLQFFKLPLFPKPLIADIWEEDIEFGRQFLQGLNPVLLRKCKEEDISALPKVWCKKYNRLHIQKGGLRRRPKVIVFSSKSTLRLTPPTRYKFFL